MNIELKKKSPYGTASLTLGIISIVMFLTWFVSLPCGILAIVYGTKAKRMVGSKLGTAGKVTGIVGVSLSGVVLAFLLFFMAVEFLYRTGVYL